MRLVTAKLKFEANFDSDSEEGISSKLSKSKGK